MKKIHKSSCELFFLQAIALYLVWRLGAIEMSDAVIYLIWFMYCLFFWKIILPRLVYIIDNANMSFFPMDFKQLKIGEQYQVVLRSSKKAILENEKGKKIVVKNFVKYASFVEVNDYLIINSISPLNIDWVARENKTINVHI